MKQKIPKKEYELFSKRLRKALSARTMKQQELCNITGISKSMISLYLSAKNMPESNRIYVMAEALGVSPAWLFGADINVDGSPIQITKTENLPEPCKDLIALCQQMNNTGMTMQIEYAKYILSKDEYKKEDKNIVPKKITA